jgi:hypothetical protein
MRSGDSDPVGTLPFRVENANFNRISGRGPFRRSKTSSEMPPYSRSVADIFFVDADQSNFLE